MTRQRKWEIDLSGGGTAAIQDDEGEEEGGKQGSVTSGADFAPSLTHTHATTTMMIRAKCSLV